MEPFGDLADLGVLIVIYDQFGCGASLPSEPHDRARFERIISDAQAESEAGLWTVDLFMDELENLVRHLVISSSFDLLGQSWGGMLATQFVIERKPKGLRHFILANTTPSIPDWVESSRQLIEPDKVGFPREMRNIIKFVEKHPDLEDVLDPKEIEEMKEKGVGVESREYEEAMTEFMRRFDLRIQPWPESFTTAIEMAGKGPVTKTMWGPAWTTPTGILANWSIMDRLYLVDVPTLIYNGAHEEAQDWVVAPFFNLIPKRKWVRFKNSSHMPHYEERERCMQIIGDFVRLSYGVMM